MATYTQEPGSLNIALTRGDELGASFDFSNDLSGHSLAGSVVSLVSAQVMTPLSVSVTSATAGLVSISLTELQTSALPSGTYGWHVYWDAPNNVRRTALSGTLDVRQR